MRGPTNYRGRGSIPPHSHHGEHYRCHRIGVYFCCVKSAQEPVVVKEEFGKKEPGRLLQLTIARAFDLIESCIGESRA